ncbi:VOC family protein [Chitinophaga sp. Cy-1792]|uniref:VOC family protein n=1 Tax=Chitinophaga sp. Cy-1792 TaxID=2608339 RepID=UPI0014208866|nr:VOC family protein [Chitinophaga sp. Cy-1792]NIG52850.1 VOC family protein [Chitinophaga sp. Cy-1792]
MSLLKKIDATTNVITWFEIPVSDIASAKIFYETILDIEMTTRKDGENEAVFFPYDPAVVQATSGRVTGVLSKSSNNKPSENGTTVYLNASPSLDKVLGKVIAAGGKIVLPRTPIPAGFIAIILDPEGNRVGLHAES